MAGATADRMEEWLAMNVEGDVENDANAHGGIKQADARNSS